MSKTPSIAVIPSGYKASKVYSVLPTNGDADLDFTRNCVATRVNQNGLLEEVGLNVPRLDYSDGGCPSLLLEPQTTNLVTNAIVGDIVGSVDVTLKTASPSGLIDARIPIPSTIANRFESTISLGTFATDDILTYSWYRKRITTPINDSVVGDLNIKSLVNLTELETSNATQIASDINGFDRFKTSVKIIDGALESKFRAYFGDVVGVGNQSVAYYGHQLELGTYATSLIYTSGAEVTRFKDEASKDNLESYINSSEGVLYAEFNVGNISEVSRYISVSDGTASNRVLIGISGSQDRIASFLNTTTIYSNTIDLTANNKVVVKWGTNVFKLFVNGALVGTKTDFISIVGLNTFSYSSGSGGSPIHGKTKDIRVFNEALTDAELIELTTI